jgi:hypothetical protein
MVRLFSISHQPPAALTRRSVTGCGWLASPFLKMTCGSPLWHASTDCRFSVTMLTSTMFRVFSGLVGSVGRTGLQKHSTNSRCVNIAFLRYWMNHFDVSKILKMRKCRREAILLGRAGTDFRLKTLNLEPPKAVGTFGTAGTSVSLKTLNFELLNPFNRLRPCLELPQSIEWSAGLKELNGWNDWSWRKLTTPRGNAA